MTKLYSVVILCLVQVVVSNFAIARPAPYYDIEQLFEMADIVVIASHISTKDAKGNDPSVPPSHPSDLKMMTPVVSRMKKLVVLKGSLHGEEFSLPHYRFNWNVFREHFGDIGIGNGPRLINFEDEHKNLKGTSGTDRHYLLFLKRREDGLMVLLLECTIRSIHCESSLFQPWIVWAASSCDQKTQE